eukprot:gene165-281_t
MASSSVRPWSSLFPVPCMSCCVHSGRSEGSIPLTGNHNDGGGTVNIFTRLKKIFSAAQRCHVSTSAVPYFLIRHFVNQRFRSRPLADPTLPQCPTQSRLFQCRPTLQRMQFCRPIITFIRLLSNTSTTIRPFEVKRVPTFRRVATEQTEQTEPT